MTGARRLPLLLIASCVSLVSAGLAEAVSVSAPSPASGTVTISARADRMRGLKDLEIFVDDVMLKACGRTRQCQAQWDTTGLQNGIHTVAAVQLRWDGTRQVTSSAVTVNNETVVPSVPASTPTPQASTPTAPVPTTPTPAPPTPTSPVSPARFTTVPPGSPLPSDADCAAMVKRTSWEARPDNAAANQTNIYTQGGRLRGSYLAAMGLTSYEQRVTGNFVGRTDEILQWVACKWGIDEDVVRAQAAQESWWRQSQLGDCNGGNTQPEAHGCHSIGILQVKGANIPPTHPGTWPYAYQSTAFNADYTYAVWRAFFEGKETWLGGNYGAGDPWGCVGRWFSGDWYGGSLDYIASVKNNLANKVWLRPGF
jgi:hypothetical protein